MPDLERRLVVLDAPSNLGLRPPAQGSVPGCDKAPGVLRDAGLLPRVNATDGGVVTAGRYRAGQREGEVRNEAAIIDHSRRLADRLLALPEHSVAVVLGGDCSILVGIALALRRRGRFGLVSLDGLDYRHPGNSGSVGAAGGENLALVTGRGWGLADIDGQRPYLRAADVVAIGPRPDDEYAVEAAGDGILVLDSDAVAADAAAVARRAVEVVDRPDLDGFWVHLDADVLDPTVMPAVDSPEPGGLTFEQLAAVLRPLVASPRMVGIDLTIYDPDLDPGFRFGHRLADLLVDVLAEVSADSRA
ncbi:arginase family protein [Microbacterium paludicola]|uniref:arginase family protein n=1 Tax=Microbacterium paludicola TaxID=300019 RepID=UPI0021B654D0|nr:arginase family protein [Microbacterium paludicola]